MLLKLSERLVGVPGGSPHPRRMSASHIAAPESSLSASGPTSVNRRWHPCKAGASALAESGHSSREPGTTVSSQKLLFNTERRSGGALRVGGGKRRRMAIGGRGDCLTLISHALVESQIAGKVWGFMGVCVSRGLLHDHTIHAIVWGQTWDWDTGYGSIDCPCGQKREGWETR